MINRRDNKIFSYTLNVSEENFHQQNSKLKHITQTTLTNSAYHDLKKNTRN